MMRSAEQKRVPHAVPAVLAVVVAVVMAALLAWVLRPQPEPSSFEMNSPSFELLPVPTPTPTPRPGVCGKPATRPFTPTSITIPSIIKDGQVLALPRDANNVPSTPPTSAKYTFAWDRPPGIMPGSDHGNVLLNAHTWPDGSAIGNVMLDKLEEGDRIILRGGRSVLCYKVTKEVEVRASDGYRPYYDRKGSPKIAVIVCSGQRLGPGVWTHRTMWFAEPIPATA
jgi:hypothetical protein